MYVIVALPTVAPFTVTVLPVVPLRDATLLLLLLHVPPLVVVVSKVEPPTHTPIFPVIAFGLLFTVIVVRALQPVDNV